MDKCNNCGCQYFTLLLDEVICSDCGYKKEFNLKRVIGWKRLM